MIDSNSIPEQTMPQKFVCQHCGKSFSKPQSVRTHLSNCPDRSLPRFFKVEKYLIVVISNPLRRKMRALNELIIKFPDDVKVFLSSLKYLELSGEVSAFHLIDCGESPEFQKEPMGRMARQRLWKTLVPDDLNKLREMELL